MAGAPRVAIACQGGGSHTAFTAGVLGRLLEDPALAGYRVVGLSGTSGGAVCALLAWSALLRGEPARARELLDAFWADNSATSLPERLVNAWTLWAGQAAHFVAMPEISPYDTAASSLALGYLRTLLERRVDFDSLAGTVPAQQAGELPYLLVGAADVLSGEFKAFDSRRGEIGPEAILASAAIPTLFQAVHIGDGVYWDGLFSQNPPVRELLDAHPDEIWVVQINPQRRATEPRTPLEIADRRNELSGNMSLRQELDVITLIDRLLEQGVLTADSGYRQITVRVIEMPRTWASEALGATSKLNRDPDFIADLVAAGRRSAEQFLAALAFEAAWRAGDRDALVGAFAEGCVLHSEAPFAPLPPERRDDVAALVDDRLLGGLDVDVTHKEVAGDLVSWSVRQRGRAGAARLVGRVEVEFSGGGITRFRLR